jgi:hypothetical protein
MLNETPISKISREKWTRGVALAIRHQLWKCEAQDSNPSPPKKKERKKVVLGT